MRSSDVKQSLRFLFLISLLSFAVAGIWGALVLRFVMNAGEAQGIVKNVTARSGTCEREEGDGDSRRSVSYSCTRYEVLVDYRPKGADEVTITLMSGTYEKASEAPDTHVGDLVRLLYNPTDYTDARENDLYSLWGGPLVPAGLGLFFGVWGLLFLVPGGTVKGKK